VREERGSFFDQGIVGVDLSILQLIEVELAIFTTAIELSTRRNIIILELFSQALLYVPHK
jgi:hypothetical protein